MNVFINFWRVIKFQSQQKNFYFYVKRSIDMYQPSAENIAQHSTAQHHSYDLKSENNLDTVLVVLSVLDPKGTYSKNAGVVITSIFEHTKNPVVIYISHDETLTPENRKKFLRTAEKYGQKIILNDISNFAKKFDAATIAFANTKCTIGSLYRLFIPEILSDVDKVIYIDCDIVVNLDIAEMWAIDIENYSLAGVHSKGFENPYERLRDKLNGCDCKTFINAGILSMNLKKIRTLGSLFLNAMAWMKKRVHLMAFSDQDILNNIFYNDIKLIDSKFNIAHSAVNNLYAVDENYMHDKIIHTAGKDKTWDFTGMPVQKLYWRHYLNSAWGENRDPQELMTVLYKSVDDKNKKIPPAKSFIFRLIDSISWRISNNTIYKIAVILFKELKHRLSNGFKY